MPNLLSLNVIDLFWCFIYHLMSGSLFSIHIYNSLDNIITDTWCYCLKFRIRLKLNSWGIIHALTISNKFLMMLILLLLPDDTYFLRTQKLMKQIVIRLWTIHHKTSCLSTQFILSKVLVAQIVLGYLRLGYWKYTIWNNLSLNFWLSRHNFSSHCWLLSLRL